MGMTQVITSQMAKPMKFNNLDKNVKNIQNYDKHLMYRLFLLI